MATYARLQLSGSTDGRPVVVAATGTPGTTIHTSVSSTTTYDEIYAWVSNVTGTAATITVEWGGTTDPGQLLVKALTVPPNSPPIPLVTGQILSNGKVFAAFSGTASALNITGYVNRISP